MQSLASDGESPSVSPLFFDAEPMDELNIDNNDDSYPRMSFSDGNYQFLRLNDGSVTQLPPRRNAESHSIFFDITSGRPRTPPSPSYPVRARRPLETISSGYCGGIPIDSSVTNTNPRRSELTYEERRMRQRFDEVARLPIRTIQPPFLNMTFEPSFLSENEILDLENRLVGHHPIQLSETYEDTLSMGIGHTFSGSISYSWSHEDEEALQNMLRESRS